jgi:cation diffusion facilitator family transporter
MTMHQIEESREKRRAALLSVGSAVVLVSLKTFLVLRTGSLGVLSEALHSSLDLVAAIITLLSVRVADQPADERHLYGHGKFENFSAFVETGLLALTALYIIYDAFARLFFAAYIQPSVTAIPGCVLRCRLHPRARAARGEKYSSDALEADALHFPDVWSSHRHVGIGLVWAGETWRMPWLNYADALAGLAVAAVILWSARGSASASLMPSGCCAGLCRNRQSCRRMDGVLDVDRVRVRRAGNAPATRDGRCRTASLERFTPERRHKKASAKSFLSDVMVRAPRAAAG